MSDWSEEKKQVINVLLHEYSEQHSHQRDKMLSQQELSAVLLSAIGALFANSSYKEILNITNSASGATVYISSLVTCFILSFLFPLLIILISIIWLDNVYKQVRLTFYLYILEERINELFDDASPLSFEHVINIQKGKNIFKKVNRYYYYSVYLILSILSPIFATIGVLFYLKIANQNCCSRWFILICCSYLLIQIIYIIVTIKMIDHIKKYGNKEIKL